MFNVAKMRYSAPYASSKKLVGISFWESNRVLKYLFPKMF